MRLRVNVAPTRFRHGAHGIPTREQLLPEGLGRIDPTRQVAAYADNGQRSTVGCQAPLVVLNDPRRLLEGRKQFLLLLIGGH
jgi:hypothetical protein